MTLIFQVIFKLCIWRLYYICLYFTCLLHAHWNMPHRYETLTWPRTSTSYKTYRGDRQDLLKVTIACTTSSVTQMLQQLGWQDLQSRRRDLRLALLYKVVLMGHVGIKPEHVGLVAADDRTRAKHQFKFRAVGSSTQASRHSFAVRTVGDWNSLPSHVVEQSTTASFKAELSRVTSTAYAP